MVNGSVMRPAIATATPLASRLPSWLLWPALLVAAGVGAGSAINPLVALVALALVVVVVCIWKWPAVAAYLLVGVTPLIVGINRGSALPLIRLNEALALVVGVALVTRGLARLRTGQIPRLRLDRVELSMVLLAIFSSVVPLLWMAVRTVQIANDDLLYALVLWKYVGLYVLIRMSVSTDRQVVRCLWISVGAACIVGVIAILQSLGLFGVPRLLATWYPAFGFNGGTNTFSARGSSTLGLPAATADLMVYNLAIVSGLWMRSRRHRVLLAPVAALLVLASLSAGEFSSWIGLVVGVLSIAVVTNSGGLLKIFVPAGLLASQILQPVFAARLSGFQSASGLPGSWTGRLQNLQNYFWPHLFSNWNYVLGVQPSARVLVTTQSNGYVWIESGYTWLLWAGGIPLLASFLFFVVATAKRGWEVAHRQADAAGVAGIATFVAVIVTAVLMLFDPHLTYRGSADLLFVFIALCAPRRRRPDTASTPTTTDDMAEEARR